LSGFCGCNASQGRRVHQSAVYRRSVNLSSLLVNPWHKEQTIRNCQFKSRPRRFQPKVTDSWTGVSWFFFLFFHRSCTAKRKINFIRIRR
jgi:hypothetical protein